MLIDKSATSFVTLYHQIDKNMTLCLDPSNQLNIEKFKISMYFYECGTVANELQDHKYSLTHWWKHVE